MPGSGNKKGAQRTKGNLKPSSSSQAAELLAAAGGGGFHTGFIGFGGGAGAAAFVPVSQALEDEDSGLDPTFRVTLRKLSKRDAVTKLKALQEFSALCADTSEEAVKAALPFWPKIYNKVSVDVDHKVREASQQAMAAIASRVGRNLAPHLKSIMGCWLLCQCDTYPTVATAAQQAFSSAFPPAKQSDAIVYCKEEIAEFLLDNLTVQTSSTLSDPKTSSPEDMEMKYNRMVTSSLLAWRKLLETLPASQHGRVPATLTQLLNNPKLWKLSKSSVTAIKAAVYSFMSGVCQCQTEVAVQFTSKLAPLALHSVDETDSVLCGQLWEAVLSAITYLPECWNHVNGQKAFLPKLRKLLQNGCCGNATVVGPNILPLFSKIPDEVCGTRQKLWKDLFENLKQGLCTDQVRSSSSECGALVRAFMECAQYSVKQALGNPDQTGTAQLVLIDQVLPLIAASLVDDLPALSRSPLYEMIGPLLNSLNQSKDRSEVVESFTAELKGLVLENVRKMAESEMSDLEERLAHLLRSLINPKLGNISNMRSKSQKSVKFSSSGCDVGSSDNASKTFLTCSDSFDINKVVRDIITQVCMTSFTLAKQEHSSCCLSLLSVVITTFPDSELLRTILNDCAFETEDSGTLLLGDNTDAVTDPVLSFIYLLCVPWVVELEQSHDRSMSKPGVLVSIGHLLDISLVLLSTLVKTDVLHVLFSLQRALPSAKSFQLLLDKCLRQRKQIVGISEWLMSCELEERLVDLTQAVCQRSLEGVGTEGEEGVRVQDRGMEEQWELITSVLSSADGQEPILSSRVTERILGQIEQTLVILEKNPSGNKLETAIHFVTEVMLKFFCSLKDCLLVPSAEKLLLTLFSLSLEETLHISEACSKKLEGSWQCGVQVLVQQRGGLISDQGFLVSACHTVSHRLVHKVQSLASLERMCHVVQLLLTTIRGSLPNTELTDPTLQNLMNRMMYTATDISLPQQIVKYMAVKEDLVSMETPLAFSQVDRSAANSIQGVIYPALFSARLLLFSKTGEFYQAIPKFSSSSNTVKEDMQFGVLEYKDGDMEKVYQAIYNLTLSEIWSQACISKGCVYEEEVKEQQGIVERLLLGTDLVQRNALISQAVEISDNTGWVSALSLGKLVTMIIDLYPDTEFSPAGLVDRYSTLTISKVHSLQVCAPYLPTNEQVQVTEIMVARVISSPEDELTHLDGAVGALAVVRVLITSMAVEPSTVDLLNGLMEQLVVWRQESAVALNGDLSSKENTATLTFNLEVVRTLACVVAIRPEALTDASWDYVLCSLIGWLQNVNENQENLCSASFPVQQLCIACCHLVAKVAECIQSNTPGHSSKLPANLCTEWEEFFSEGAYSILLPLFLKLTGAPLYKDCIGLNAVVLSAVCHAVSFCPKQQVLSNQLPAYLIPDQDSALSNSIQTLLNHFCPMLMAHNRSEQIAAYWTLDKIIGDIPKLDSAEDSTAKTDEEEPTRSMLENAFHVINIFDSCCTRSSPPASLMKILFDATLAMEVIFSDVMVEDCLDVPPLTEEYNFIFGYLLSWKLLLNFFKQAPSEVRPQYAAYLKEKGTVHILLDHVFRLMPDSPVLLSNKKSNPKSRENMFEVEPILSALESSERELQHVVCSVYREVLEVMPAMARQWWKDQDRKTSAYVDKYTTKYVSPALCTSEIQTVQTTDVKLSNLTIKARAASREVIATYDLEEVKTEMVISLPANYPLGNISVSSEKRVGVSASQWEKLLLQLNIFLQHQNGSIVDGLQMWKRNIDKRFEGVEECTICYSVIHGTTLQLPRLQCRTCKKKFHSACLYKWFNTSHNSTCPLCRNLF
ncbi:E3 ubiquitin-protein ligase listerin-like [Liolophura sinensis]|uniref:E3 ubiquitin-protein ligase listerin-like n=1 Tax=Liolophura sinensis TaxID=3198878 RepID=UPI0031597E1B